MKIIMDTNLLVAAFFNKRSASAGLINLAKEGKVDILWSDDIRREAEFILGNIKKSVGNKRFKLSLDKVFKEKNKVEDTPDLRIVKDDSEDDKFLECAKKGRPDIIVSNDSHLLKVGEFENIPILTSKKALNKING